MKNMKVRTKLNLILVLVILLVALGSVVSVKNMEDVKDKALETMDASSRQSYDDSIKEQVGVVISLLTEINEEYKAGTYTLDEAKQIAAEEVRQMRYGEAGYFWIDQSDGTNVVLLGSDTEGTNRMDTKDAKGYQMVKEIIRVAVEDGGGYTDYVFPKEGETKPSPKRSYSEYFEPFDWVVGTGNYTDYIDTAIAKQDKVFSSYAMQKAIALIAVCIVMLVVVAVLVFMIAQDITKSLKKVVAEIEVIAGGNFARKMQTNMMKRKDDYANQVIKKHENTRADKEQDRIRHVDTCSAQTGPIFLAYRANAVINEVVAKTKKQDALYDFVAEDGIRHRVFVISDPEDIQTIRNAFAQIGEIYIADGHHRAASAVKVGFKRREEHPGYTGKEEFNYFLSVLFPDEELMIMDYNRVVRDLGDMTEEAFLSKMQELFDVQKIENGNDVRPVKKGQFSMFLSDKWYRCTMRPESVPEDPVEGLDVSVLQNVLLAPVLGIGDPKTDKRIDFVGGIRGMKELERRCHEDCKVAFAMYPTSIQELFAVADAGRLMPPKSTWFEPKLRSGLFIHEI